MADEKGNSKKFAEVLNSDEMRMANIACVWFDYHRRLIADVLDMKDMPNSYHRKVIAAALGVKDVTNGDEMSRLQVGKDAYEWFRSYYSILVDDASDIKDVSYGAVRTKIAKDTYDWLTGYYGRLVAGAMVKKDLQMQPWITAAYTMMSFVYHDLPAEFRDANLLEPCVSVVDRLKSQ
jgi:hypothetical protein